MADIAAVVGDEPVLPWRDVLHDGPVPDGLGAPALARLRAQHLARRGWAKEEAAFLDMRDRDIRLATHPPDAEIVLWFEDDLYDALQLAQIEDRLVGRAGVVRVQLGHPPARDLAAAFAAREALMPTANAFAALRSPDPSAWEAVPAFARLLEELPDARTGLSRTERQILDALADGPLDPEALFLRAADEDPPWLGDWPLWAMAVDLAPLVDSSPDAFAITEAGRAVLAGDARHPPPDRWLGGTRLSEGWAWNAEAGRVTRVGGLV